MTAKDRRPPAFLKPGYVDPGMAQYLRKFRAFQKYMDGGKLTADAKQIKDMLNADAMRDYAALMREKP